MKNTRTQNCRQSPVPTEILRNRSGKKFGGSLLAAFSVLMMSGELSGETLYSWNAASGLFPDQVAPTDGSITLTDTSSLDVFFDAGLNALTFPGDTVQSSALFYDLNFGDGSASAPSNPLENGYAINFEVRIDSSAQFDNRRGAVAVSMRTGQSRYSLAGGIDFIRMIRDFRSRQPNRERGYERFFPLLSDRGRRSRTRQCHSLIPGRGSYSERFHRGAQFRRESGYRLQLRRRFRHCPRHISVALFLG